MFGRIGDIANLLKQAGQIQQDIAKIQEELAKKIFEADAGAGLVKARVNGRGELIDVRIDPQAVADVELLEDLVKGAVSAALLKAREGTKEELAKVTAGMPLPGLEQMFGKGE